MEKMSPLSPAVFLSPNPPETITIYTPTFALKWELKWLGAKLQLKKMAIKEERERGRIWDGGWSVARDSN